MKPSGDDNGRTPAGRTRDKIPPGPERIAGAGRGTGLPPALAPPDRRGDSMLRTCVALVLGCLLTGTAAAETKSGPIKFTGPMKESVQVTAGSKVKLDVTLKQISIGLQSADSVCGTVTSTT